ncbi:MAG TPA: hypothetical protein VM686_28790 [Polyangiaceae bacterium]|nr:hypothetical protein [Polyangiaceae bacterium]
MRHLAHATGLALALAAGQALAQAPAPAAPPPAVAEPPAAAPADAAAPATDPGAAPPVDSTEPAAPPPAPLFVAPRPAPPPAPVTPAESPDFDDQPEPDDGTLGTHQQHLFVGAGVRTNFVHNEGFELFSENEALPQFSLHAGSVLLTDGALSLVALGGWDYGQTQSTARGATTELDVHRLWVGAEGRYHLWRRIYGFGRLAPVALHSTASLRDNIARAERSADSWVFGAEATLGAALELFGKKSGGSRTARGWLALGGGYGIVTSSELMLEADEDSSAPIRTAALDMGDLSLSGRFVRVDFTLSF